MPSGGFENIEAAVLKTLGMDAVTTAKLEVVMKTGMAMIKRDAVKACPKKTGHLRRSITTKVTTVKNAVEGEIGSNLVYAEAQEKGTTDNTGRGSGIPARWYIKNAIEANAKQIMVLLKRI